MRWLDGVLNNKISTSRCSRCPHRLQLLVAGDCQQIGLHLEVREVKCETDFDCEPNQICTASCLLGSGEITTRKFFKLDPEYWRKRYLLEHMGWPYDLLYS